MIEMIFGKIATYCESRNSCEDCPFSKDIKKNNHYRCIFHVTPEEWDSEMLQACYLEMCAELYLKEREENEKNEQTEKE